MQTRSSSRLASDQSSNPTSSTNPNPKGRNRTRSKQRVENSNLEEHFPPVVTMADQRTMAQFLQAPTEGYEDAIVILVITSDNFELKHGLLTLVQNKQFFGHDKEDPHAHIRYFNKITSTLKFPNVLNTSIKLMLFLFFLKGAAQIWLEKEPPRSILTWDDLVSKFINQFFPPSKTTRLCNEITNFQQRFDETFSEAWDRFKVLVRACPHHGFSKLHQLDMFYNTLNSKDQDSLNSVAGGNFLDKMPRDCLSIIESKSKICYSRDMPVVAKLSTNASTSGVSLDVTELKDMVRALLLDKKRSKSTPAPMKAVEESCVTCGGANSYKICPATDGNVYRDNIQEYVSHASVVNYNQGNTSYHPQMMSNKIRPPGFPPVPNNQNVQRNNQNRFIPNQNRGQNMQNQLTNLTDLITKFVNFNTASTSSSGTLPSNTIANPKSDLKAITTRSGVSYDGPQILPLVVENEPEAIKDTVNPTNSRNTEDVQPQVVPSKSPVTSEPAVAPVHALKPNPKASIPYLSRRNNEINHEKANHQIEKFYQIFKYMSMAECLALADLGASINLMPLSVWKNLSLPDLTPTCMTLELADCSISHLVGVAKTVYVKVGSFHFPADFVVVDFDADPRVPLILIRSLLKTGRALIDVFEVVELKALPPHLEYVFLESDNKLPVIIAKDLSVEEKSALITVLKSYKRVIAWKISNIKGINPEFCTHKILMEQDFTPEVQRQRRANPKIHDVIKQEVIKLLDAGLIYPISDSPWDQEKTTFTCPYGTFAYRCMPFGLCNAPGTFQRCMVAIFHDMIEKTIEVFMDDFSVFENSFQSCLSHLEKMLKKCEDTNLCLNWEKSHFMVKEAIVLGHKISKQGIEVDKAKVDVISKLSHPTTVKGIRSFLGHARFYRRFIKDFSKIARPMTRLLEKDTPFIFSQECVDAFQTLKRKLTEAPILIAPDWDMPFELMCDASDFAIGAVLGQHHDKHSRPIHYASKTMTEEESKYTTIKKEMLAVVYAFEKFQSYLILNKSIVYTDHSALKYLFAKKDSKARLL
nr:reverse transcriptase domain-containing protein [Tanacetum cinerariifolium]